MTQENKVEGEIPGGEVHPAKKIVTRRDILKDGAKAAGLLLLGGTTTFGGFKAVEALVGPINLFPLNKRDEFFKAQQDLEKRMQDLHQTYVSVNSIDPPYKGFFEDDPLKPRVVSGDMYAGIKPEFTYERFKYRSIDGSVELTQGEIRRDAEGKQYPYDFDYSDEEFQGLLKGVPKGDWRTEVSSSYYYESLFEAHFILMLTKREKLPADYFYFIYSHQKDKNRWYSRGFDMGFRHESGNKFISLVHFARYDYKNPPLDNDAFTVFVTDMNGVPRLKTTIAQPHS